eukprot:5700078-Amphidinium_carterae.1
MSGTRSSTPTTTSGRITVGQVASFSSATSFSSTANSRLRFGNEYNEKNLRYLLAVSLFPYLQSSRDHVPFLTPDNTCLGCTSGKPPCGQ